MRLFEIVLILVNLLSLSLAIKKQSKVMWLGIAVINLSVLLIHGAVEGFRYEMVFSYIFVFLLLVLASAQASGKFATVRIPKALKVVAVCLSFLLLALTSFLAYALPVFSLPKLTGDYAVGIRYYQLVDENRKDPFLVKSPLERDLMIKVYYPAKEDNSKPFSPYFHGSAGLIRAMAQFYHLPAFVFHHLGLVKTHAKDGLAISGTQPSYPVVLFSHGAGASMEVETSQSEDLASHGYIVVDVDHTYVSMATEFPGRIVTAQEATTNFDTPEPAEPITQIMADDDKFVIDELGRMTTGKLDSALKGKLNLGEIGVIGHSVGGAVAYNLAINDSRVKAAINLDGVVYITPKDPKQIAPFLMLANDQYHVQAIQHRECLMEKLDASPDGQQRMHDVFGSKTAYDAAYNRSRQDINGLADVLKASGNLYTIEGSDHMKFTDIGLFIGSRWLRNLMQIRGRTDPARCLVITQAVTAAFFDRYLKGQPAGSLASVLKEYPELKQVSLE